MLDRMSAPNLNCVHGLKEVKMEKIDGMLGMLQLKSNGDTLMETTQVRNLLFRKVAVMKSVDLGLEQILHQTQNSFYH